MENIVKIELGCPYNKQSFAGDFDLGVEISGISIDCPYCKTKHYISDGKEKTLEDLISANKAIPKYIDYWNYGPEEISGRVDINGTFFNHDVIYFSGKQNWMVENPRYKDHIRVKGIKGDKVNKGVPYHVFYNGTEYVPANGGICFSAKPSEKDIIFCTGIRISADGKAIVVNDIKRARIKKDKNTNKQKVSEYKGSCGKNITNELGASIFPATYYSWLMNNKNEATDEGETLDYSLKYTVTDGTPSLSMTFTKANSKSNTDQISINGEKITVGTLSVLADRLGHQTVTNKKRGNAAGVQWYQPKDWMDIADLKNKAINITNAVYMWWGVNSKNQNDIYLYVGIVGANSSTHSVFERITEEMTSGIANDFGVTIKQFRYSMLKSSINEATTEILKTVEMQTINNISSVIQVHGNGGESIIHPFLGNMRGGYNDSNLQFTQIGNGKRIILINRDVRYHQS